MKPELKKIIQLIFGITIFITILAFSLILIFNSSPSQEKIPPPEKTLIPQYTTSYENINVSYAKELIETNSNLTIVECTGGCQDCTWKYGSYLPQARWIESPEKLYNWTYDLLIYCQTGGQKSFDFCEKLLNHVYGKIYNLEGGYIAWRREE